MFISAPTYHFSKFCVKILPSLLTYDFSIKNFKLIVQRINETQCDDNDYLASFNFRSLFTCIPVLDGFKIIENLLLNDASQAKRIKLFLVDNTVYFLLICVFILQFLPLTKCFIVKFVAPTWGFAFYCGC